MKKNDLLQIAIKASIEAGKQILSVYGSTDFGLELKGDASPLTKADTISNQIIIDFLKETDIPIISEENKATSYDERKEWERCWVVDPLDGTKEFIKRNGEFTVNIALIIEGKPILGVIYTPVSRELYFAHIEDAAYKVTLDEHHETDKHLFSEENRILNVTKEKGKTRVVGSRSHMNEQTENFIKNLAMKEEEVSIVSKGSSLKFCLVAEGKADVYPRFAPTMEWDTAAGHAICNAAGYKVEDVETGNELQYNKKELLNPYFLVH